MSTCISRHGEHSSHTLDSNYTCTRCGVVDEYALIAECSYLRTKLSACRSVMADRERELLLLKGPCSSSKCSLHYAHSGPCDTA
jgi:hypothetical protein